MEFKLRNKNRQVLRHAPSRNDIEAMDGTLHTPDMDNTLSRLKKQYFYVEFFNMSINDAVKRAKIYVFQGLIVASTGEVSEFAVLDRFGTPFENTLEFRSVDSSIKNQSKRYNLSHDGKLALALGRKREEDFQLRASGIKIKRDKWDKHMPTKAKVSEY